jgi:hypothetical protein
MAGDVASFVFGIRLSQQVVESIDIKGTGNWKFVDF